MSSSSNTHSCKVFFSLNPEKHSFTSKDVTNDMKYIKVCSNSSSAISLYSMNDVLISKNLENTRSRAFKCFLHCLLTKYGWMDEDGGFLIHDIRETLQESDIQISTMEYILYSCTAMKSMNRCHRAFYFTECFWKKMDEEQPAEDDLFYEIQTK
ncbi:uncharacterized protein LOC126749415 [Anthonomus grandis grandis]|uniref:uncharacterized protein LOC126749415 n=1 Tax=Anthonomus grandis grandis TaxID=2921223 RepID=UPI002166A3B0|nr:uncharacterized protein LOC126749415 [Anthonomus grandis grandis]